MEIKTRYNRRLAKKTSTVLKMLHIKISLADSFVLRNPLLRQTIV